jgi:hypothetical protein
VHRFRSPTENVGIPHHDGHVVAYASLVGKQTARLRLAAAIGLVVYLVLIGTALAVSAMSGFPWQVLLIVMYGGCLVIWLGVGRAARAAARRLGEGRGTVRAGAEGERRGYVAGGSGGWGEFGRC